jgi:hypothetical protein
MSEDMYDRGGKIPIFDGEAKNFVSWWKKFFAYAMMSKFKDILKETKDRNLPEEEISEDNDEITKAQQIVRHDGMHKHSVPLYSVLYFNLEFSGIKNQGQGCYEGNVRSEVRFSEVLLLL